MYVHWETRGITSESPFASRVFDLVYYGAGGCYYGKASHKFDTAEWRKHFWKSAFAKKSLRLVNEGRNNLALFIRDGIKLLMPPPVQMVAAPESQQTDPDVNACVGLYSAARFGREDTKGWSEWFLPIAALAIRYREGKNVKPLRTRGKLEAALNEGYGQLVGKTVAKVMPVAYEALIRLIILKHLHQSVLSDKMKEGILISELEKRPGLPRPESELPKCKSGHYLVQVSNNQKYTDNDLRYFATQRDSFIPKDRQSERDLAFPGEFSS